MKIFKSAEKNFEKKLNFFLNNRSIDDNQKIDNEVKKIIRKVKFFGNKGLFEVSKKIDGINLNRKNLLINQKIINKSKKEIDKKIFNSFKIAISNVYKFHKIQFPKNFKINKDNIIKGYFWKPIDSVGLYVPGGKAVYPSSLIMNVVPAKVAGVRRIVLVTPCKNGNLNPYIAALIQYFGIKEVYNIGGAQGIAALTYGTESINPVDKIFGPGNAYVTSAKKQVFGKVGIDLIAGPSEITVIADEKNNPDWVAADIVAQAEHDERAQAILITNSKRFSLKVLVSIKRKIKNLPKKNIIEKSLKNYGAIIITNKFKNVSKIINLISPEHLHLHTKLVKEEFKKINNAGLIFIGEYSAEPFGDYIVGTNHILPTSRSSKFSSGISTLDFMKRTSFVKMNRKSAIELEKYVNDMTSIENLDGHKLSVKVRKKNSNN